MASLSKGQEIVAAWGVHSPKCGHGADLARRIDEALAKAVAHKQERINQLEHGYDVPNAEARLALAERVVEALRQTLKDWQLTLDYETGDSVIEADHPGKLALAAWDRDAKEGKP